MELALSSLGLQLTQHTVYVLVVYGNYSIKPIGAVMWLSEFVINVYNLITFQQSNYTCTPNFTLKKLFTQL